MFDPAFYEINSHFGTSLTNFSSFLPSMDYLLRFVVDGWAGAEPSGVIVKDANLALATVLASAGDLDLYDVKAVTYAKVPAGEEVGYYSPSWYMVSWGKGYTDTLTAGPATWVIDLVFRPKAAERSWTSVEKWTQILSGQLGATLASLPSAGQGTPQVHCGGLIPFDVSEEIDDPNAQVVFVKAAAFWSSKHAFFEVSKVVSESSPTGFVGQTQQINKSAPMMGWNAYPPFMGHNGLGCALGSALDPESLKPKAVEATTYSPPPNPNDPSGDKPDQTAPATWQTLPTSQKVAAAFLGVVIVGAGVWAWNKLNEDY